MKKKSFYILTALAVLFGDVAWAQQSVEDQLNDCVKKEQIKQTAVGAVLGGLFGAFIANSQGKDTTKGAAAGAVVGGVGAWIVAFNTGVATCHKAHPEWIPEAKLQRTKDYARVRQEINYSPQQGAISRVVKVSAARQIKAGSAVDIISTFQVMTPDGGETKVALMRVLTIIIDGKENQLGIVSAKEAEETTVEAGEQQDTVHIQLPPDLKAGQVIRYYFGVSVGGQKPTSSYIDININ